MREVDLSAMTEVRLQVPYKQALGMQTQAECDGEVEIKLKDVHSVSLVKMADIDPRYMDPDIFTEVVETNDGLVEVVTQDSFRRFAEHENEAEDGKHTHFSDEVVTRAYNALARGLNEKYIQREGHFTPVLGIKAELFTEMAEGIREGSMDIVNLGKKSKTLVEEFAEAFKANREGQNEAVEGRLVELGASALATERHELEMRFG